METLLPIFFSMYITIYLGGYFVIFRKWKGTSKAEASSCLISLAHGTPAVLLAMSSLLKTRKNNLNNFFATKNTGLENMVLEYSMAYFSIDLLHYFYFLPNDVVFIAHHLATLYVFTTCRYIVNHGAQGLLALLFLAEVTSACQNTWTIARLRRRESPATEGTVEEYFSLGFYLFYFVVRGCLGPIFVYKMGRFYFSGWADGLIPKWAWYSWILVIGIAIFFSVVWISKLMNVWWRERGEKSKRN